jgi:hypothetical protein
VAQRFVQVVPCGPRTLFEISTKTCQGEFLLAPDPLMVAMSVGLVELARRSTPGAQVHTFSFQSNHYHLMLSVTDWEQLGRFMNILNSDLARAINLHRERFGRVWEDTYWRAEVLPEVERERAVYIAGQGLAKGLYERAFENPCAHTLQGVCNGRTITGLAPDVRAWQAARRIDPTASADPFLEPVVLTLSPLPHLAHLPASKQRAAWQAIVKEADQAGREARKKDNIKVLGAKAMRRFSPFFRPERTKHGSKPVPCLGSAAGKKTARTRNRACLAHRAHTYDLLAEFAVKLSLSPEVFPPTALRPFLRRHKAVGRPTT